MPHKNYLPGGIIMCVFSVIIFFAAQDQLDLPALVFIALLFISGVWAVLSSLFKLDAEGSLSWIAGAVWALGFAVLALSVAWCWKKGWSGIPFIPDTWNQTIPRISFASVGFLAMFLSVVFLRKAFKRYKKDRDEEV